MSRLTFSQQYLRNANLDFPIEIYADHGLTTEQVLSKITRDAHELPSTAGYKSWITHVSQQLAGQSTPGEFSLAFLSRTCLGFTKKQLQRDGDVRGVSGKQVLDRVGELNKQRGIQLRPCRPTIPFLMKVLGTHFAPFHFGFAGTGLINEVGKRINVHYRAPLDFTSIAQSREEDAICYEYWDDGYSEEQGPRRWVFEI